MSNDEVILFSHALMREAALSLLSSSERTKLHGLAMAICLPDSATSPEGLSQHVHEAPKAQIVANAGQILRLAAGEVARGNASEALQYYDRLASLPSAPVAQRIESMLHATRLLERAGQKDAAWAMAQRALELADDHGDAAWRGQSRLCHGGLLRRRAQFKAALAELLEAEQLCRAGGDQNGQAESVCERGMVHQATGALERAEECFVAGERLFRRKGNLEGVCRALGNLALIHGMRGHHPAALAALEEAAGLADILGNALIRARIWGNRANVHSEMGQPDRALEAHLKALAAFEACGDARGIAATHVNLGGLLEQKGELAGADAHYDKAQRLAFENGDAVLAARVVGSRGVLCAARGNQREARALYTQALAQARALGDREHEMHLLSNIGRSWQKEGKHPQALDAFETALQIAKSQKQLAAGAALLALKAQSQLDSGKSSAAQQTALDTMDWCDRNGLSNTLAQFEALVVLARHEGNLGNLADARMLAREAQDLAARLPAQSAGEGREVFGALQSLRALEASSAAVEPKRTRR